MQKQGSDTKKPLLWTPLPAHLTISHKPHHHKKFAKIRKNLLSLLVIFLFTVLIIMLLIWYYSTVYVSRNQSLTSQGTLIAKNDPATSSNLVAEVPKKIVVAENCYGLTVPFEIRKINRLSRCSVSISLKPPMGMLTVDYREDGVGADDPNIGMRRANQTKYEESTIRGRDDKTFVVFKNIESTYFEKTAYLQLQGVTIGVSLRTDSASNYDKQFEAILSSLYCVNECKSDTLIPAKSSN